MPDRYLVNLKNRKGLVNAGGKAQKLHFLLAKGFRVPESHICLWDAYEAARQNQDLTLQKLRAELAIALDLKKPYAVRSSANIEDGAGYSFAGQYTTRLNVQGLDRLIEAIREVWASAQAPQVGPYLEKAGIAAEALKMAAIVQQMVPPAISGVSFSKNPMTGMDEIVVEAVAGSGEKLVQEGITPDRWVYKWGQWLTQPEHPIADQALIASIVEETQAIARSYGAPIDLEWVYDGRDVHWLQLREITTLKDLNIYSNRISREVLPGIIKPLVWSVNVPMVNSAWVDLFTELIGPNDIQPEALSKAFHYRAYFNMSLIAQILTALGMPSETLELLLGLDGGQEKPRFKPSAQTLRHAPRMIRFILGKLAYGRQVESFLPQMQETYRRFADVDLPTLDEGALLEKIDALYAFTKQAAYANIVAPLLMSVYNSLFNRRLAKIGFDFIQFDLMRGFEALDLYDPNVHLANLHDRLKSQNQQVQAHLKDCSYAEFNQMPGLGDFQEVTADFINRFGHFSDSGNDFSCVPWRENPELVLQMIANYVAPETASQRSSWQELPLGRLERWRLNPIYRRARQFRFYREAVSYWYTFGYGLFRNYFLALADHFVASGLLQEREDVFYLYWGEVRQIGAGDRSGPWLAKVGERKEAIDAANHIVLPDMIFGDQSPPPVAGKKALSCLKGVPTSRGYFKGPVKIVRTVNQFEEVSRGSVFVIPYSDVSWTPLFAKAGAVIAESGGILSHSSIVAREFDLPAVVSVNGVCDLLDDGMLVTVDGYRGEIVVHQKTE